MARLPRLVVANHLHHVIARGNNEQSVFIDDADCQQFLDGLREAARQYRVAVHGYVLLPNRVQLLVTPTDDAGLGKMMQAIGRRYVPYFNARHRRSGSLWEGRFRTTVLDADAYFMECARLLEYQPVKAGLAADMVSYPWSSHAHHLGLRKQAWLTDHAAYWKLGNTPFDREIAYQEFCSHPPERKQVDAIEEATSRGWALGSASFKAALAKLTDRRLQPARRGRPPKVLPPEAPVPDRPAVRKTPRVRKPAASAS
jgi:putative transposase